MLNKYFKIAWRNLAKNKVPAAINIFGLAIGICACMVIYLIAHFELSYEDFQPDRARIYRPVMDLKSGPGEVHHVGNVPYQAGVTIRDHFSGIDKVAGFFTTYFSVTVPNGNNTSKRFDPTDNDNIADMIVTDPDYFSIFRYQWLAGNAASALKEPFKVVLTESKAHRYFGDIPVDEMMGRELIYDDSLRMNVTGIVKDLPANSDFHFSDFISISTSVLQNSGPLQGITNGYSDNTQVFIKLSAGVSPRHFGAQIPVLRADAKFAKFVKADYHLQPLADIHFNADYGDRYSRKAQLPLLYGLMCIAAFILIIAAVNFANLSTAQSFKRAKEIGVRKVMGSSRTSLAFQFLCESFLMCLFAGVLSLLLLKPALNLFHEIVPNEMVFSWRSPSLFLILLAITVLTSFLAGIYPARVLSSYRPALCLKDQGFSPGSRKNYVRKALIVFQFSISLLFIIATMVINNQVHFMLNRDPGFKKEAIIAFDVDPRLPGEKKYLLAENIRRLAGVDMVSVAQDLPQTNYNRGASIYCKDNGTVIQESMYRSGDEYYVPLFGLRIIAGRNFIPPAGQDSVTEFLVNETEARLLGFNHPGSAVGHIIQTGNFNSKPAYVINTGPIVGVVADFNSQPLNTSIPPTTIIASKNLYYGMLQVKLSSNGGKMNDHRQTIAAIAKLWKNIYPNERFDYVFFDSLISSFYTSQENMLRTMNLASMVAILISCLGLFGISAFIIVQRTKEIGIRKVLGASVVGIVRIVVKEFVALVGLAAVVAFPLAWFLMHRWLDNFAYRIHMNIWLFLMAGLSALFIALVTVGYHSVRAAIADPIQSLKKE